jgi:hypothetical protein
LKSRLKTAPMPQIPIDAMVEKLSRSSRSQ